MPQMKHFNSIFLRVRPPESSLHCRARARPAVRKQLCSRPLAVKKGTRHDKAETLSKAPSYVRRVACLDIHQCVEAVLAEQVPPSRAAHGGRARAVVADGALHIPIASHGRGVAPGCLVVAPACLADIDDHPRGSGTAGHAAENVARHGREGQRQGRHGKGGHHGEAKRRHDGRQQDHNVAEHTEGAAQVRRLPQRFKAGHADGEREQPEQRRRLERGRLRRKQARGSGHGHLPEPVGRRGVPHAEAVAGKGQGKGHDEARQLKHGDAVPVPAGKPGQGSEGRDEERQRKARVVRVQHGICKVPRVWRRGSGQGLGLLSKPARVLHRSAAAQERRDQAPQAVHRTFKPHCRRGCGAQSLAAVMGDVLRCKQQPVQGQAPQAVHGALQPQRQGRSRGGCASAEGERERERYAAGGPDGDAGVFRKDGRVCHITDEHARENRSAQREHEDGGAHGAAIGD